MIKTIKGSEDVQAIEQSQRIQCMLKKHRKSLGLTQEQVAKKAKMTRQMVSKIEIDATSPSLLTLLRYLNAVEIDLENVLYYQIHQYK